MPTPRALGFLCGGETTIRILQNQQYIEYFLIDIEILDPDNMHIIFMLCLDIDNGIGCNCYNCKLLSACCNAMCITPPDN